MELLAAMDIATSIKDLRNALRGKGGNQRTGFIPTMGALHAGHLSLVSVARSHSDRVAASIFVNPTQFAPGEDLDAYPRTLEGDLAALERSGCDVAFVPQTATMYPSGEVTRVTVPGPLSETLEGAHRPHFFTGVATVVTKLLASAQADVSIFGEKDFQQLQVIRRMAQDLLLGTEVIGAPTIRAEDGLALSSRNTYLDVQERQIAPKLYQSLRDAHDAILDGVEPERATDEATSKIQKAGFGSVDYIAYRSADTLAKPEQKLEQGQGRLLAAAWLGKTRLIDNIGV